MPGSDIEELLHKAKELQLNIPHKSIAIVFKPTYKHEREVMSNAALVYERLRYKKYIKKLSIMDGTMR